jgi:hypothetical protein
MQQNIQLIVGLFAQDYFYKNHIYSERKNFKFSKKSHVPGYIFQSAAICDETLLNIKNDLIADFMHILNDGRAGFNRKKGMPHALKPRRGLS